MKQKKLFFFILYSFLIVSVCFFGKMSINKITSSENRINKISIIDDNNDYYDKYKSKTIIENMGQLSNEEILFYYSLSYGKIAFCKNKILLYLDNSKEVITLNFVNSNPIEPVGINPQITQSNYYLGSRGTFTDIKHYDCILYTEIWTGIDLQYKITPKGLKYDFIVTPEGNPNDIKIQFIGQDSLDIIDNKLVFNLAGINFIDEGLLVYQDNFQTEIEAKFSLIDANTYGFTIGKFQQDKQLIIDPIIYSTYVGGSSDDKAKSLAISDANNIFVAGETESDNFLDTGNNYNLSNMLREDIFVIKLSSDGSTLLYSTFIGGSGEDYLGEIVIDSNENAYVVGYTSSLDFPVTSGAMNETINAGVDGFYLRLSSTGTLDYCTYFGGDNFDRANSLVMDSSSNLYITGMTSSSNFPTTDGALNTTYNGGSDCFVLKISSLSTVIQYSTYIGGTNIDEGIDIAVDELGYCYIVGNSNSDNFPTTLGAYRTTYSGWMDVFISKISIDGSTLLYSTYLGGSTEDEPYALVLDDDNNAYVTGYTESSNFPTTIGAYDTVIGGSSDAFVSKISTDGSSLSYSTFIGGSTTDEINAIDLDAEKNAYLTGKTFSNDFPLTDNTDYRFIMGETDAFAVKLSADGTSLINSTYLGGIYVDHGLALKYISDDTCYIVGYTSSPIFPTTDDAYNKTYGGADDCFVIKYAFTGDYSPITTTPPPVTVTPPPETITIPETITQNNTITVTVEAGIILTSVILTTTIGITVAVIIYRKRRK